VVLHNFFDITLLLHPFSAELPGNLKKTIEIQPPIVKKKRAYGKRDLPSVSSGFYFGFAPSRNGEARGGKSAGRKTLVKAWALFPGLQK